jgi:hypothetical protein
LFGTAAALGDDAAVAARCAPASFAANSGQCATDAAGAEGAGSLEVPLCTAPPSPATGPLAGVGEPAGGDAASGGADAGDVASGVADAAGVAGGAELAAGVEGGAELAAGVEGGAELADDVGAGAE